MLRSRVSTLCLLSYRGRACKRIIASKRAIGRGKVENNRSHCARSVPIPNGSEFSRPKRFLLRFGLIPGTAVTVSIWTDHVFLENIHSRDMPVLASRNPALDFRGAFVPQVT